MALTSLRATTLRSLALAATGALALFGSVALGGASGDLLRGVEGYIHGYASGPRLWIVNPGDPADVELLPTSYAARVAAIPGVSNVRDLPGRLPQSRSTPCVDHRAPAGR